MQSLLNWIVGGLGTLLFGACVVAWWEHLGRDVRQTAEPDWDAPAPPLASVDVDLGAAADAHMALPALSSGDVRERRQALGGAMTRMSAPDRRQGPGDTVPMILSSLPGDTSGGTRRDRAGDREHESERDRDRERERSRATASD